MRTGHEESKLLRKADEKKEELIGIVRIWYESLQRIPLLVAVNWNARNILPDT